MLEVSAIRSVLPHGHPMLLVDRVLELTPRSSIVATKAITAGEPCYRDLSGDLPAERYAYPGSLMLESFGQSAALLWLLGVEDPLDDDRVLMLVAARNCRIEGRALPGDVMRHAARIDHVVGENVFVDGETYVGERRVAVVESMMAAMRPRSSLDGPSVTTEKKGTDD